MTTASSICRNAQRRSCAISRQSQRLAYPAPRRIGTRNRAFATCHLAGSSTLLPRGD